MGQQMGQVSELGGARHMLVVDNGEWLDGEPKRTYTFVVWGDQVCVQLEHDAAGFEVGYESESWWLTREDARKLYRKLLEVQRRKE